MDWHDVSIPQETRKKEIVSYYINKGFSFQQAESKAKDILKQDSDFVKSVRLKLIDKLLESWNIDMSDAFALEKIANYVNTGFYGTNADVDGYQMYLMAKEDANKCSAFINEILGSVSREKPIDKPVHSDDGIISSETYSHWFDDVSLEEIRKRIKAYKDAKEELQERINQYEDMLKNLDPILKDNDRGGFYSPCTGYTLASFVRCRNIADCVIPILVEGSWFNVSEVFYNDGKLLFKAERTQCQKLSKHRADIIENGTKIENSIPD